MGLNGGVIQNNGASRVSRGDDRSPDGGGGGGVSGAVLNTVRGRHVPFDIFGVDRWTVATGANVSPSLRSRCSASAFMAFVSTEPLPDVASCLASGRKGARRVVSLSASERKDMAFSGTVVAATVRPSPTLALGTAPVPTFETALASVPGAVPMPAPAVERAVTVFFKCRGASDA